MMPSELALLAIDELLAISKAIAMLDAVMSPDWQYRYYSFNSKWSPGEQMASMRNGSGDDYFILFNRHGAILKGYDHESVAAAHVVQHGAPLPGMFDSVPKEFAEFLTEPAFSINQTTFCHWRKYDDANWHWGHPTPSASADAGGARSLLSVLTGGPSAYAQWARGYYEVPVDLESVQRIYRHEPLSLALVHALNPRTAIRELQVDIEEIGFRTAVGG